jgi:hypothetical protein
MVKFPVDAPKRRVVRVFAYKLFTSQSSKMSDYDAKYGL